MKSLLIVLAAHLSVVASAGDLDARDKAVQFFKTNLVNRTVAATTNDADSDFEQTWKYENLNVTSEGFTYDEVIEIKQTVFELDADGKRVGSGVKRNRNYKTRTEIGQLKGSNYLYGFKRTLSSSFRDSTGSAYTVKMEVDDKEMVIHFDDAHPTSWPKNPPATGHDLLLSKHVETLFVDSDGKLNRKFTQDTEVLDPVTLAPVSKKPQFSAEQKEN